VVDEEGAVVAIFPRSDWSGIAGFFENITSKDILL